MADARWHPLDGVPPPAEVPPRWDAGHVAFRLVRAYEVLHAMPAHIGPQRIGSAWPAILREFSDYAEESVRLSRARELTAEARMRWPADEIAKADEALGWPLRYLSDQPRRADALTLWALAKARRRSLRRMLRERAARASRLAHARRIAPHQAEPHRILSDSTLRRYLPAALELLASRLAKAGVPIR